MTNVQAVSQAVIYVYTYVPGLKSGPYVGDLRFGINCHPLDSVNPESIWRAPLLNPVDSRTGIHKVGQTESRFGIFFSLLRGLPT